MSMNKDTAGVDVAWHQHWLPVSLLEVDPIAQRSLNRTWVKARIPEFDPEHLGLIVVNRRKDGRYMTIDGQHRKELLIAVGWGDQKVPCQVYEGLTLVEEAREFLARNTKINVQTFDKFRIRIVATDPVACDIERIVRAQGLRLDPGDRDGCVRAVAALEKVYSAMLGPKKSCPAALAKTLKTLRSAWGDAATSFDGKLIEGLGLIFLRYAVIDEPALVAKLAKSRGGAPGILGKAKAISDLKGGTLARCVGSAIVDLYNQGRRTGKLEDWWAS